MMKNCKLFIFSSELESCPQTILEARSIGCPILSTNIAPMPEFLKKDGIYFDIDNFDKTSDILINILNRINKKKIKKRKKIDEFDWKKVILKYLNIFKNYAI
jgi:glycosyltransferase involved in cell wall biosynthesis